MSFMKIILILLVIVLSLFLTTLYRVMYTYKEGFFGGKNEDGKLLTKDDESLINSLKITYKIVDEVTRYIITVPYHTAMYLIDIPVGIGKSLTKKSKSGLNSIKDVWVNSYNKIMSKF